MQNLVENQKRRSNRETMALMVEQYQTKIDLYSTSSEKESSVGSSEYDNTHP